MKVEVILYPDTRHNNISVGLMTIQEAREYVEFIKENGVTHKEQSFIYNGTEYLPQQGTFFIYISLKKGFERLRNKYKKQNTISAKHSDE